MSTTLHLRCLLSILLLAGSWLTLAGCGGPATTPAPATTEIDIKVVKFDQWLEAVKAHQGKVVVADIWADFCIPCKKEFPHLVELHHKYGKDGLVCMSVSVDKPEKKEVCLEFLKSRGATFPNYLMNEKAEFWQDKWDINAPPAVLVFDRDGKQSRKFDNTDPDKQYTYAEVESFIQELLRSKS